MSSLNSDFNANLVRVTSLMTVLEDRAHDAKSKEMRDIFCQTLDAGKDGCKQVNLKNNITKLMNALMRSVESRPRQLAKESTDVQADWEQLAKQVKEVQSDWNSVRKINEKEGIQESNKAKVMLLVHKIRQLSKEYNERFLKSVSSSSASSQSSASSSSQIHTSYVLNDFERGVKDRYPKMIRAIRSVFTNLRNGEYGAVLQKKMEEYDSLVMDQKPILILVLFQIAQKRKKERDSEREIPPISKEMFPEIFDFLKDSALIQAVLAKMEDMSEKEVAESLLDPTRTLDDSLKELLHHNFMDSRFFTALLTSVERNVESSRVERSSVNDGVGVNEIIIVSYHASVNPRPVVFRNRMLSDEAERQRGKTSQEGPEVIEDLLRLGSSLVTHDPIQVRNDQIIVHMTRYKDFYRLIEYDYHQRRLAQSEGLNIILEEAESIDLLVYQTLMSTLRSFSFIPQGNVRVFNISERMRRSISIDEHRVGGYPTMLREDLDSLRFPIDDFTVRFGHLPARPWESRFNPRRLLARMQESIRNLFSRRPSSGTYVERRVADANRLLNVINQNESVEGSPL